MDSETSSVGRRSRSVSVDEVTTRGRSDSNLDEKKEVAISDAPENNSLLVRNISFQIHPRDVRELMGKSSYILYHIVVFIHHFQYII